MTIEEQIQALLSQAKKLQEKVDKAKEAKNNLEALSLATNLKYGDNFYYYDWAKNWVIEMEWRDNDYGKEIISKRNILHNTRESAEVELSFNEDVFKHSKPYEYGGENYYPHIRQDDTIVLGTSKKHCASQLYFSLDNLSDLIKKYPVEIWKLFYFKII